MILRALLTWLIIVLLAILNGFLRQGVLVPAMGETWGRALSSLLLSLLVIVTTWFLLPWISPSTSRAAWLVGITWLVMTLAFEFLAGHYLFGNSWEALLADYNVAKGRIWVLVLIVALLAPPLLYRARMPE